MFKRIAALFAIGNLLLTSCYKNHLYVQQEKLDPNFLASIHVHTPDPRQKHPPEGQRLVVAWDFPIGLFRRGLTLVTTVRLWDQTQREFVSPVKKRRGYLTYDFLNDSEADRRILTYRIEVISKEGELVETWEHHFWTELIDVDRPERSSLDHGT